MKDTNRFRIQLFLGQHILTLQWTILCFCTHWTQFTFYVWHKKHISIHCQVYIWKEVFFLELFHSYVKLKFSYETEQHKGSSQRELAAQYVDTMINKIKQTTEKEIVMCGCIMTHTKKKSKQVLHIGFFGLYLTFSVS